MPTRRNSRGLKAQKKVTRKNYISQGSLRGLVYIYEKIKILAQNFFKEIFFQTYVVSH